MAAHLEYLPFILMKFDSDGASEECAEIRYVREDFKPLVRVEMEQHGWELNNFDEIVAKAVDAKAKTALRPRSSTRKTNQYYA